MSQIAHPFVKWAGGKTQLLPEIRKHYPHRIKKYCEPFVGGGAVLFDVLQKCHPEEVLINDVNAELINVYSHVKSNVRMLSNELICLQNQYLLKSQEERKLFFIEKRNSFNSLDINGGKREKLEKAALFIFLNKTCFNGLYRVNKKGEFNVPFNNAKNPLICDEENLKACSELLKNVKIITGDYSRVKNFIDSETFVYLDPPYRPLTQTSAFTSYSENQFSDKEQIELGKFITEISNKGAKVLASNSDPKNTNKEDDFFDNLYSNFEIERISASRMINSNAKKRGAISELLISNIASVF
ncbi:MAG: DNA adenine methylase [Treponema sp.]|nr:DNA adenine methylase [Treponema sp.]